MSGAFYRAKAENALALRDVAQARALKAEARVRELEEALAEREKECEDRWMNGS